MTSAMLLTLPSTSCDTPSAWATAEVCIVAALGEGLGHGRDGSRRPVGQARRRIGAGHHLLLDAGGRGKGGVAESVIGEGAGDGHCIGGDDAAVADQGFAVGILGRHHPLVDALRFGRGDGGGDVRSGHAGEGRGRDQGAGIVLHVGNGILVFGIMLDAMRFGLRAIPADGPRLGAHRPVVDEVAFENPVDLDTGDIRRGGEAIRVDDLDIGLRGDVVDQVARDGRAFRDQDADADTWVDGENSSGPTTVSLMTFPVTSKLSVEK